MGFSSSVSFVDVFFHFLDHFCEEILLTKESIQEAALV